MNRKRLIATFALTTLLSGGLARAQAPAGYELALVNVDGTKTVVGQLPPSVYAPRVSPDGKRIVVALLGHLLNQRRTSRETPRANRMLGHRLDRVKTV